MKAKKILFMLFAALSLASCSKKQDDTINIAVFIPGIMADSPIYANLAQGVQEAVNQYNASLTESQKSASVSVMEAGTNQAEWQTKLTSLASQGIYDLIISSNPSLPQIAEPLTQSFPKQKFLFLDASLTGNPNIACISYNQKEQSYLTGYIAGLFSSTHKVALIAAQEYPVMNTVLYPYYAKGAEDAVSGTTCEFRVVGNWYDAGKGAEITDALYTLGVDVILPICGGASQGVISSAVEHGIHLNWFDENGFSRAPGTIISSCMAKQQLTSKEATLNFLNGKTDWGTTQVVGFAEGYVEFITDDALYEQAVPLSIRQTMDDLIASLNAGTFVIQ